MTTFSKAELAVRVLRDLGLYGAEETPSAADQSWAEQTIQSEVGLLAAKGINIWNGSDEDIPDNYLTALSRRIGLALGPSFGLFSTAQAEQAMPLAEANLRRLSAIPATGAVSRN